MTDFNRYRAASAQISPVDLLLSRLEGVRQTAPGKWLARCPAHEDRSPSLSVKEGDTGAAVTYCFAGCDFLSIVHAVGLEPADLFPPRHGRDFDPTAPKTKPPRFRASELLPLIVTEAVILAIAWQTVAEGRELSEEDRARADLAEEAVMGAYAEVFNG